MLRRYLIIFLQRLLTLAGKPFLRRGHLDVSQHSIIIAPSTYSPWIVDQEFQNIYKEIRDYTPIDKYKLYELWQLTAQVAKLHGDLIEVGCGLGGSGCLIARQCQLQGITATVYLCDAFNGVIKPSADDPPYVGGTYSTSDKQIVERLSRELRLDNIQILRGVFPDETGEAVRNKNFRLCHVDIGTYQSSRDAVHWVWSRLVTGGVVVEDDYGYAATPGIRKYVHEISERSDNLAIHNLNGHSIMVKVR